ncbi:ergot alkaloid biosynthesis protein [Umezawaea sp. Da 62-37]|uniref:ergot alkaloid biosynthesis protein n=1 Tax=Umezawaea sp. Da 62-37 TaxID=3075927 RepID=UPI0028F734A4|nr:ergot alkaloid biosynthesis protein [Umezawaea sp. Da 62-37]WNV86332.1 ergot alkaloid biosynthesis protein [Umezawaea sp. Da 62-37]
MSEVLVIGATGTTGSRVAAFLREHGTTPRPATRTPRSAGQVRFDWADRETHAPALRRVSAVYLVAPVGVVDPVPLVEPFLQEALRQDVRRVVLLSSSAMPEGVPPLGALHGLVAATMPEWAVLRPSWFMQNFTGDHPAAAGARAGGIVSATGGAKVAFVDAGDIAAVAGRALTDDVPHNTAHLLTGPTALSYADVAGIVSRRLGTPVRHRSLSTDELVRHLVEHGGMTAGFAGFLAALDEDVRGGSEDRVTDTVERVTGRPARSFQEFADTEIMPAKLSTHI